MFRRLNLCFREFFVEEMGWAWCLGDTVANSNHADIYYKLIYLISETSITGANKALSYVNAVKRFDNIEFTIATYKWCS